MSNYKIVSNGDGNYYSQNYEGEYKSQSVTNQQYSHFDLSRFINAIYCQFMGRNDESIIYFWILSMDCVNPKLYLRG